MLPSLASWQIGRAVAALWSVLETGERIRLCLYVVLPTVSRFVLLGSFGVTMKGFVAVNGGLVAPRTVWIYGIAILVGLLLGALLQSAQQGILARLNLDLRGTARRVLAGEMERRGREGADEVPREISKHDLEVEKQLSKGAGPGLVAAVELISDLVFVTLMLAAITVALPLAGLIMALIGLFLLAVFRLKVRHVRDLPENESRPAVAERKRLVQSLLGGEGDEEARLGYERNELDLGQEQKKYEEKRRESRFTAAIASITALVVALCFLLVATTGLRAHDPIHLIVFVIAVRLFAMQGKQLLKHWAEILRRKNTLFAFSMILTGRDGFGKLRGLRGSAGA